MASVLGRTLGKIIDQGGGAPGQGIASVNALVADSWTEPQRSQKPQRFFLWGDRWCSMCYAARKLQMMN